MWAQSALWAVRATFCCVSSYACTLSTRLFLKPSKAKKRDGWIILLSWQRKCKVKCGLYCLLKAQHCVLFLWHYLAAGAAPLPKTSTSFLFMKTRHAFVISLLLPSSVCYPRHASVRVTLSTPHLAHTCHSGQHALVVAFPGNLTEEKVDFIIIWIVGVCNGVSRYKLGLC